MFQVEIGNLYGFYGWFNARIDFILCEVVLLVTSYYNACITLEKFG